MVANGWRVKNTNIYFSPITISTSFVDYIICIHHDKIQSYPKCTKQFHFISFDSDEQSECWCQEKTGNAKQDRWRSIATTSILFQMQRIGKNTKTTFCFTPSHKKYFFFF